MIIREWRKTSFYNEILSIPNVQFLHHSIKTEDVMKKLEVIAEKEFRYGNDS